MADFLADTGAFPPESLVPPGCTFFGLVMNTERVIHRAGRRELTRFTLVTSDRGAAYELFRASTYSVAQADTEFDGYNLYLARLNAEVDNPGYSGR